MQSDEDLALDFFGKGDRAAYTDIVNRHAGFVLNVAHGVLHDRGLAEDVLQETFLSFLKSSVSFQPTGSFRGWIGRIAYNKALDMRRAMQRRRRHERIAASERVREGSAMEGDPAFERDTLKKLVMTLPLDLRIPVVLKYFQKATQEQISEILECSASTVSSRLDSARKRLREALFQTGLAAVAPVLETHLLDIEGEAVSDSLLKTLTDAAGGIAASTAAGGIVASKTAKIVLAAVVAVSAVLGLFFLVVKPWEPAGSGPAPAKDFPVPGERVGDIEGVTPLTPGARGEDDGGREGEDVAGRESDGGPEEQRVPPPERRVVLRGVVVDGEGKPVAGARVVLTEEFTVPMGPEFDLSDAFKRAAVPEDPVAETRCNDKGEFAFHAGDAREGLYCMRVSAQKFATSFVRDIRWDDAAEREPIQVVLQLPAALAGKITDTGGTPLGKAIAVAVEEPDFAGFMAGGGGKFYVKKFWTYTKRDGSFRLADLPPGRYIFMAHKKGFAMATRMGVLAPSDEELRVELRSGFIVEGRVVDAATGEPVSGARIVALSKRMSGGMGQAESDGQGRYRFDNLAPGYYQLVISARGYVQTKELVEAEAGERVEQDFRLLRKIAITGKVLDAATRDPLAGVRILSMGAEDRMFLQSGMARAVSGPDGGFTVKEAAVRPDGRRDEDEPEKMLIWLIADAAGWVQRTPLTLRVEPGATSVESVEILMHRAPRVLARVINASGDPVKGAAVAATFERSSVITVGPDGHIVRDPDSYEGSYALENLLGKDLGMKPRKAVADGEGRFSLELPLHGRTWLWVHHPDYAFGFHEFGKLTAGEEVKDVVVRLSPGGSILGRVTDERGEPVAELQIECEYRGEKEDDDRSFSWVKSFLESVLGEIRTDEKGAFALRHMRPGLWRLSIESKRVSAISRQIVVSEGVASRVQFQSRAPLAVKGLVVDESGASMEMVSVNVRFKRGSSQSSMGTWTDREGRFRFEDVPEGTHEVSLQAEGQAWVTVKIRAGEPERRIVLKKAAGPLLSIEGFVVEETGAPLKKTAIMARIDQENHSFVFASHTDGEGRFKIENVPPGEWEFQFFAEGHSPGTQMIQAGAKEVRVVLRRE